MSNKRNEPDFKELEAHWYEKLRTAKSKEYPNGFNDIEKVRDPERPLMDYHSTHFVKESVQVRQSEREAYNKRLDDFINHRNFDNICRSLTRHGNSSLKPSTVKKVLELHRKGETERDIAQKIKRSQKCVHITLAKAQEWMKVA